MEPLFVVAKITESPGKNDNLLFHSKLFQVWLWALLSFEGDYDQLTVTVLLRLATRRKNVLCM